MKDYYKIMYIFFFVAFCFSCKKENKNYKGISLVEFSQNELSKEILFTDTSDILIPIQIQLASSPLSENKIIHIKEVDSNTAVLGKHYIVNDYNVVLKSGEIFATFNVIVKASKFAEGEAVSVLFGIISDSSEIKPANNYKTFKLSLSKQSFIDVFVGRYKCDEPVNQDSYLTSFIQGTEPYTIKNTNFWNFPSTGQNIIYTLTNDTSMVVQIKEQRWVDKSGKEYLVSGTGKYDIIGNITVNYRIRYNGLIYETGVHKFTPIRN